MKNHILALLLFSLITCCNSQDNQKVEYQKAFAKTYGYVKYFHPSPKLTGTSLQFMELIKLKIVHRKRNS
jgi:hypothetical protein